MTNKFIGVYLLLALVYFRYPVDSLTIQQTVARYLLSVQAVRLQPDTPFTWSSGWKSPIYCDNRVTLAFPDARTFIKQALADVIRQQFPSVEVIAGVATAGIPQGALVADAWGSPTAMFGLNPRRTAWANKLKGIWPLASGWWCWKTLFRPVAAR
jgi:orotate phosphoribosyltransferase